MECFAELFGLTAGSVNKVRSSTAMKLALFTPAVAMSDMGSAQIEPLPRSDDVFEFPPGAEACNVQRSFKHDSDLGDGVTMSYSFHDEPMTKDDNNSLVKSLRLDGVGLINMEIDGHNIVIASDENEFARMTN